MSRILFLCACYASAGAVASAQETMTLWSQQPGKTWCEALPLGNGRLGAMVFGSAPTERLQLNEESLWAGAPLDVYPDHFAQNLKTLRQLVLDGHVAEAQAFGIERLTAKPTSFRSYEPLADLWIELDHESKVEDYRRELDLRRGVARVQYRTGGVILRREVLISAVDDVLAVRISADKPGAIAGRVHLTRQKDMCVSVSGTNRLQLDGQIIDIPAPEAYDDNPDGSGPGGRHMKFAGRLLARARGGTVQVEQDALRIEGADEVVLLFTAATDFNLDGMNFDRSIDPGVVADGILAKVADKPWDAILRDHIHEHRSLFDRVSIDLGRSEQDTLPTDRRLAAMKEGVNDPGLTALYFQFGRYLLMSSSRRPGRIPANLQGIWNDRMWAAWESDFHLNVNMQMNYWPADVCNLSETVDPFTDWFEKVAEKGRVSAQKLYDADGWVAFTTVNLFGRTTPGGSTVSSQFLNGVLDPLAGAWMALTLWRHCEFTQNEPFLRDRAYPILKGASEFLLDYLVEDDNGHLIIVPSTSPENSYTDPETGRTVRVTQASTYHMTLVRAVFESVVEACRLLGADTDLRTRVERALARIPPTKISPDGRIQEWFKDFKEQEPGHRHLSHLLGLHPFAQITPRTPEFFDAAEKTLGRRLSHGGGQAGWSRAWLVSFYARLLDGDEAYRHALTLVRRSTHPNFLEDDPLFQIDCFLAATAGIAEMLLQSHDEAVHLLPALPNLWPTGHVYGLKARGGFIVDMEWENGTLTAGRIRSEAGHPCRVRSAVPLSVTSEGQVVDVRRPQESVIEFATEPGNTYVLTAR